MVVRAIFEAINSRAGYECNGDLASFNLPFSDRRRPSKQEKFALAGQPELPRPIYELPESEGQTLAREAAAYLLASEIGWRSDHIRRRWGRLLTAEEFQAQITSPLHCILSFDDFAQMGQTPADADAEFCSTQHDSAPNHWRRSSFPANSTVDKAADALDVFGNGKRLEGKNWRRDEFWAGVLYRDIEKRQFVEYQFAVAYGRPLSLSNSKTALVGKHGDPPLNYCNTRFVRKYFLLPSRGDGFYEPVSVIEVSELGFSVSLTEISGLHPVVSWRKPRPLHYGPESGRPYQIRWLQDSCVDEVFSAANLIRHQLGLELLEVVRCILTGLPVRYLQTQASKPMRILLHREAAGPVLSEEVAGPVVLVVQPWLTAAEVADAWRQLRPQAEGARRRLPMHYLEKAKFALEKTSPGEKMRWTLLARAWNNEKGIDEQSRGTVSGRDMKRAFDGSRAHLLPPVNYEV